MKETFLPKFEPVEVLEPAVVLDVVSTVAKASVPLGNISGEQVLNQALGIPILYAKIKFSARLEK